MRTVSDATAPTGGITARLRRRIPSIGMAALALLCLPCSAATLYKSVGPDGRVTYSDVPPRSGKTETMGYIGPRAPVDEHDPVKASIWIYVDETLVEEFYRFCSDEVPESAEMVGKARDQWMGRHEYLRAKKNQILHDKFSTAELVRLADATKRDDDEILVKVRRAPQEEKAQWCRDAPGKFYAPELNPAAHPILVKTITDYKIRS